MKEEDKITYERNGNLFNVFHDPSEPPLINLKFEDDGSKAHKWGFSMVSVWQSHLDQNDGVLWDISPTKSVILILNHSQKITVIMKIFIILKEVLMIKVEV